MADAFCFGCREKLVHGVHIAVDSGIQARSRGFQPRDHLAPLLINPDDLTDIRFHFAADRDFQIAKFTGQAAGNPRLHGKILFGIDADHLDFNRTAVSLQGSKKDLRRSFFHPRHLQRFLRHGGIHVKRPGGSLQEHVLEADFALRLRRHQNNIGTQTGFQALQAVPQRQHDHGTAEDRQCQKSGQQYQRNRSSRLSLQILYGQRRHSGHSFMLYPFRSTRLLLRPRAH